MSETEQKAIVGGAALEHSEAKRKLAMLESKARTCANSMRIIAYELNPTTTTAQFDPSNETFANTLAKCLNREEISSLLQNIKTARIRVSDLAKALNEMGVST